MKATKTPQDNVTVTLEMSAEEFARLLSIWGRSTENTLVEEEWGKQKQEDVEFMLVAGNVIDKILHGGEVEINA